MFEKYKFIRFLTTTFREEGLMSRLYLWIRMTIFPFFFLRILKARMAEFGNVFDVGCGYGIVSFYLAYAGFHGNILGVDIDADRIQKSTDAANKAGLTNLSFLKRDLIQEGFSGLETYDTAILADVLHHLDEPTQRGLLAFLAGHAKRIIIKDIDTTPRYKYLWNYFHDRYLMSNEILCFLGSTKIREILEDLDYQIERIPVWSIFPYPHYLFIAVKHPWSTSYSPLPASSTASLSSSGS